MLRILSSVTLAAFDGFVLKRVIYYNGMQTNVKSFEYTLANN